ncbi:aldose 1-epimerase [Saccharolobus islandicus]|uniref:aldose 1-epimerase n=1 Tax=Saccharolobus islandicus TaxID=43080 RepID=UPI0003606CEB|nr:aldose 1-epimerase [Sulfolobus islandicus]
MKIKKGDTEAEILTKGAYLNAFRIGSKDMILKGDLERPTRGGMAILIPYSNRVKNAEYIFEGVKYTLPQNREGNAIHGLVMDKEFSVVTKSDDSVSLEHVLEHEGYPSRLDCLITYKVFKYGLRTKIVIRNVGNKRAPLTVGAHPYFITADDWRIIVEKEESVKKCVSFNKIPTGELIKTKLEHTDYDDCFLISGSIQLHSSYSKVRITRRNMPFVQIYTGIRGTVAIEPMSGAPDAYHNGLGLKILEPNESSYFAFAFRFH